MVTIFGGVSMRSQVNALRQRPKIVVGCPGRVLDLLQQGVLRLDAVETLVLDEADHMFDMGFLPDIRKILAGAAERSAEPALLGHHAEGDPRLADDLLTDPHVVELADAAPAATIDHALYPGRRGAQARPARARARPRRLRFGDRLHRTKHRAKRLADS